MVSGGWEGERAGAANPLRKPVGRPFLDRLCVCIASDRGATVLADILRIVADQTVALTSDAVLNLAFGGDFEAFLHTAFGLQLGHFHLLK